MRMIDIDHYNEATMSLAMPIMNEMGEVLAAPCTMIDRVSRNDYKRLGIEEIAVYDMAWRGIAPDVLVDMVPWTNMIEIMRDVFVTVQTTKLLDGKKVVQCARILMDMVRERPFAVPLPVSMMPFGLKGHAHEVNVAFLSLQIGTKLGYDELQLQDLAVGCLLHDIGKALTTEDAMHSQAGFELVNSCQALSLSSAHVVYQHHESFEGNGYPRGLKGTEILELAQVCAVANLYDHFLSPKSVSRHEAQDIILALKDMMFMRHVVEAFDRAIPSYIPGTMVCVHQGEDAMVTRLSTHVHRPYIRYIRTGEEVNLSAHPNLIITTIQE